MKKHNTMKRLLAIAAAAALTLSLCACGPASEPGGPSSNVDGSAEPSQAVYSVAIIKQMDHPSTAVLTTPPWTRSPRPLRRSWPSWPRTIR